MKCAPPNDPGCCQVSLEDIVQHTDEECNNFYDNTFCSPLSMAVWILNAPKVLSQKLTPQLGSVGKLRTFKWWGLVGDVEVTGSVHLKGNGGAQPLLVFHFPAKKGLGPFFL